MRVVFLTHVYPYPTSGFNPGIERVVGEVAPALVGLGHEVHVITSYRNGTAPPSEVHRGVNIHRVSDLRMRIGRLASVASLDFISLAEAMFRQFATLISTSDVAHTFTPLHRWPFATSLVAHFHHFDRPKRAVEYLYLPTSTFLWRRTFLAARAVAVVSQYSRDELRRAYGDVQTPIEVIHNGVDLDRFSFTGRDWALQRADLLYVGPLLERKGIQYLIAALPGVRRRHPSVRLRIVGRGPYGKRLHDLANTLGVSDCVDFLGFVPDSALKDLYASSSVFAFPSLHEGFGIVLAEAMATGLPIVACDCTAVPEVVGDCGVLVPPRDAQALALALGELLDDPRALQDLSERGYARARSKFTWAAAAAQLKRCMGARLSAGLRRAQAASALYRPRELSLALLIVVVVGIAVGLLLRILPWMMGAIPYNPGDPARYYLATLNLFETGWLTPNVQFDAIYSQVGQLLRWPGFHLLQATLAHLLGVDLTSDLSLFFLGNGLVGGILLAVAGFLLGKVMFDMRVGVVSSAAVLYIDQAIYYQSEYHAQGLGLALVLLAIAAYLRSASSGQGILMAFRFVSALTLASALIGHHFSSYILIPFGLAITTTWVVSGRPSGFRGAYVGLLLVLLGAYTLYVADDFLRLVASRLDQMSPGSPGGLVSTNVVRPWPAILKFASRAPFVFLGVVSVSSIFRRKLVSTSHLAVIAFTLLLTIASLLASSFLGVPLNRPLVFIEVILVPFVVHGAISLLDSRHMLRQAGVVLVCVIGFANVVSVYPLSYWGLPGPQSDYYWYAGRAVSWPAVATSADMVTGNLGHNSDVIVDELGAFYNALLIAAARERLTVSPVLNVGTVALGRRGHGGIGQSRRNMQLWMTWVPAVASYPDIDGAVYDSGNIEAVIRHSIEVP